MNKVLEYLRGESSRVANNADFMEVYNLISNQCDLGDCSAKVYDYFGKCIESYIKDELVQMTKNKTGEAMVELYV